MLLANEQDPAGGERRSFPLDEIRIEEKEGEAPLIVGHAALFDVLSVDLGGFREKIERGAFSKAVGSDVRALFNHDPNIVLGRTRAKTLRLAEDSRGLAIEIEPPDTGPARSVVEALRRGDVSQMSFAFRTIRDKWEQVGEDEHIRTLLEVELFDVSPVTFPAYPQTDVALRSFKVWQEDQEDAPGPEQDDTRALELMRARTLMAFVP